MRFAMRAIEAAFKVAVVLKGFRGGLDTSISWLRATLSLGYYPQCYSEPSKTTLRIEHKAVEAPAQDVGFSASARRLPKELG